MKVTSPEGRYVFTSHAAFVTLEPGYELVTQLYDLSPSGAKRLLLTAVKQSEFGESSWEEQHGAQS